MLLLPLLIPFLSLPLVSSVAVAIPSTLLPDPASHLQPRTNENNNCNTKPTPTLPFTLAAFQSPYPENSTAAGSAGVTGVRVRAFGGSLWVNRYDEKPRTGCGDLKGSKCPPGTETVLWVDAWGGAWLDSQPPQAVYLNTATGVLSYLASGVSTFPPGANAVNFLHLGQGTTVTTPIPGTTDFVNAGPASFNWIGSSNDYWFLCPRPGPGYQVMKYVGGTENWNACLSGIQLIALDYTGKNPAAGVYL